MLRATADITDAKIAIATLGQGDPARLQQLAARLIDDNQIGYARRVLETTLESAGSAPVRLRVELRLQLAFCTYKDPDLPLDDRLDRALAMLEAVLGEYPALPPELRQEALATAGAIHKRRWSVYGLRTALDASRTCYTEAYQLGVELDSGHAAVNAALALDLIAAQERCPGGAATPAARSLEVQAEAIREKVIAVLRERRDSPQGDFWYAMTLAETYLGTGRYENAREWAAQASSLEVRSWQLETAARQLAMLARLQAGKEGFPPAALEHSEAWTVLQALLGTGAEAALSFSRGKVGLALSGGGFRASLYHIGVLARLAELDMLRHVEVISCVSGGSILGAYYYLELKHLLETKADAEIGRDDYIELVRRIEREFVRGVQRNIRMRSLLEFRSNLKTLFSRRPPVSERLGELYERELYSRIDDGGGCAPRYLTDLLINPHGTGGFRPKYDNWRRLNKVPILVLNATTLNTCHNWQFTASFMGEPPAHGIAGQIDANDRFRRMYHDEAPPGFRRLRLGWAVAASACVPGLFDPLMFDGLYENGYVTRLVDGGVFDNQGVASLLEQDCTVLLVSDASGQTGMQKDPPGTHLGAPTRANNILMARVRETQCQLLARLRDSAVLSGLMFVHLKKGLRAGFVDWAGCPDPSQPPQKAVLTGYGIRQDVQSLIAAIRTDLDSFSGTEADALMLSGYAMTADEFPRGVDGFPVPESPEVPWRFLSIQRIAGNPGAGPELTELKTVLRVAQCRSFKAWRVSRALNTVFRGGLAASTLIAFLVLYGYWDRPLVGWAFDLTLTGRRIAALAGVVAAAVFLKKHALPKWLHWRNQVVQCVLSLAACLFGWAILQLRVRFVDPQWNASGPRYREAAEPEEARPSADSATAGT